MRRAMFVLVLAGCSSTAPRHREPLGSTIVLRQEVHFMAVDGEATSVPPGEYRVEAGDADSLRLESTAGTAHVIPASPVEPLERVEGPTAVSHQLDADRHAITLTDAGGSGWMALGTYSGARPRGTVGDPGEHSVLVPPASFDPAPAESFATVLGNNSSSAVKTYQAVFSLPRGAVVTELTMHYRDGHDLQDVTCYLQRCWIELNYAATMATVQSSGMGSGAATATSFSNNGPFDGDNYFCRVVVSLPPFKVYYPYGTKYTTYGYSNLYGVRVKYRLE